MERSTLALNRRLLFSTSSLCHHLTNKCSCPSLHKNVRRNDRRRVSQRFRRISLSSSNDLATRARAFHSNSAIYKDSARPATSNQAYPLSGYYSDLLSFHYPQAAATTALNLNNKESRSTTKSSPELTKEEKMSIVFGSRLAGPASQSARYNPDAIPPESEWKTINGVRIPPRPAEPDNCCMSGCAHCVWDDYRDDMEEWALRAKEAHARAKAKARNIGLKDTRHKPSKEVAEASLSMDDDGGGSESNWDMTTEGGKGEDLFSGIPTGIREFMKTEKILRERKRQQQQQ